MKPRYFAAVRSSWFDNQEGNHVIAPRYLLSKVFYSAVVAVVLIEPAFALVSEAQCEAIRAEARETSVRWIGLNGDGELTPLRSGDDVNGEAINKVVYLHRRGDEENQPTVIGVKLTFQTKGNETDRNWVRVKRDKTRAFSVTYDEYQAFHTGQTNLFKLKNNFHLSPGMFSSQVPFFTFNPKERRSQLRYADVTENEERTFRSYLFIFDGVQSAGSCVDFAPVLPEATKELRMEIIDLLEDDETATFYRGSISIGVKE